MNTNERKPLLSHDAMVNLCEEGQLYPWQTEARKVRDYYESLITTGKLRVVEEVRLIEGHPDDSDIGGFYCSGCLRHYYYGYEPGEGEHCAQCGNKIKR